MAVPSEHVVMVPIRVPRGNLHGNRKVSPDGMYAVFGSVSIYIPYG